MNCKHLNPLSERLNQFFPKLGSHLQNASLNDSPIEYLSEAIANSSIASLTAFIASSAAFIIFESVKPEISMFLGFMAFASTLIYYLIRPTQLMKINASKLEGNLIYGLHAVNIELSAGQTFAQAMESVSNKNYGQFSKELKKIICDTQKYGLSKSLETSAHRNPSKPYRRALWQIINSIETGADIKNNIEAIINDLKKRQEHSAKRYGRSMERHMTFYIMGGIVFPALSVVLLQTVSALGLTSASVGENTYWSILFASSIIQFFFIYLLKFQKPALLGADGVQNETGYDLKKLMSYAGINTDIKEYILKRIFLSLAISLWSAYFLSTSFNVEPLNLFAVTFILTLTVFYTRLTYLADKRGVSVGEYLPDSLRIMAANIKCGIPVEKALFMSSKEEFGVLGLELKRMSQDMVKNQSFQYALEKLKTRLNSHSLHMSINLIGHGIRSGRGLSNSLFQIADILQDRELMKQSVATQFSAVKTTVLVLVMISSPILFSCSIVAGSIMGDFRGELADTLPADIAAQSFINPTKSGVTLDFLNSYIITSLLISSILGSFIVGQVTTGRITDGLRYVMALTAVSEITYVLVKNTLLNYLGGALL